MQHAQCNVLLTGADYGALATTQNAMPLQFFAKMTADVYNTKIYIVTPLPTFFCKGTRHPLNPLRFVILVLREKHTPKGKDHTPLKARRPPSALRKELNPDAALKAPSAKPCLQSDEQRCIETASSAA
eukprot:3379585-Pleurochrysis_carterae.AAC.2